MAEVPGNSQLLSKEQYELLMYLEQSYWKTGALPSYEVMKAEGIEIDEELYTSSWNNAKFKGALKGRGIPEYLLGNSGSGKFNGKILTEQQMLVANTLLDVLDTRSRLKKLTELGVSTATYNLWLRDPVYRSYCMDRAEALLVENQPVAHLSLINRVTQGDLGAVKYFNAMTGRYRERERAAVEVNVNQFGSDKLIAIVEIIQRHVKEPAVLEAIAGDILALNAQSVSGGGVHRLPLSGTSFINGEIGEIKAQREIVDERTI